LIIGYARSGSATIATSVSFQSRKNARAIVNGMLPPTRTKSANTSVDTFWSRATSARIRDRSVPVGFAWKNRSD
jgi:hypothetical protein